MSASENSPTAERTAPRAIVRSGVVALGLSLVVNWIIASASIAAGVAPELDALSYGPITFLTAVGVGGAVVVYAALTRISAEPDRLFVAIAAIALVISLIPDFTVIPNQPGGSLLAGGILAVLHVTTAVACVVSLTGFGPGIVGRR
jgi:FtsH-binding integral membrane protein